MEYAKFFNIDSTDEESNKKVVKFNAYQTTEG